MQAASRNQRALGDRFLLGEELGRGGCAVVFKGMDLVTGDTVAIKQISLAGISQDNLQSVQGEIELLKTLNHKNIVKYVGSFKTRTHLYIILEFMENGALSAIIKPNRFGVFPETLVAVYIAQVLQGLQYLHDQGVVHRDIKGANILTTKEGLVKLADFGVAAKLGELEERRDELQQHVVGTPYWMAPEVIEMTQVTPASDIWSVGCLIVELLTGSPPYYDLQPMSALFRIVQDDHPPLPESVTPLMQDFLMLCFQKDPKRRPDARTLLQHEWIQHHRRTLRSSWRKTAGATLTGRAGRVTDAHESVTSVIARMMAAEEEGDEGAAAVGPGPSAAQGFQASPATFSNAPRTPITATPLRDGALGQGQVRIHPAPGAAADYGSSTTPPANIPLPPMPQHPGQVLQGTAPGPPGDEGPLGDFISRLQGEPVSAHAAVQAQQQRVQLASWLEDREHVPMLGPAGGSGRLGGSALFGTQQMPAVDPVSPSSSAYDPLGTANSAAMELRKKVRDLVRALRPATGAVRDVGSTSPTTACRELVALLQGEEGKSEAAATEAKQHFLGEGGVLVLLELLDSDNSKFAEGALELLAALTSDDFRLLESLCLVGVVPAVCKFTLPPHPTPLRLRAAAFVTALCFAGDSTLHMFVACQGLKQLVAMVSDSSSTTGANTSTGATSAAGPTAPTASTDSNASLLLTQSAVNCIWRVLESYSSLPLNYLCRLLAQAGLVPKLFIVLKQTIAHLARQKPGGPTNANTASSQAAPLTRSLPTAGHVGDTALAATAAVGGGWVHGATMDPRVLNKSTSLQVARPGTAGSPSAMTVDSRALKAAQQQHNSLLSSAAAGAGPALSSEAVEHLQERVVSLLLVLAHADAAVKGFMCARDCLQHHLDCLSRLRPPNLVKLMRALRWLTSEHAVLPAIKEAGAIATLVPFLARDRPDAPEGLGSAQGSHEAQLEALHALYNICKFNKKVHLEAAATVGAIPHLCRFAQEGVLAASEGPGASASAPASKPVTNTAFEPSPAAGRWASLRNYVVPMLVGMVSCSSSTRAKLWAAAGLDVFLALLAEPDSQVQVAVLGALENWLSEDHARLEQRLTQRESVAALVGLVARTVQSPDGAALLPQLLDILRNMIGRSSKLAVALAVGGLVTWLLAMIDAAAPIVRVKLLEIIRCLYEHYPRPKEFLVLHDIPSVLRRLLETAGRGSDAVHQEAQRLMTAFQINVLF